MSSHLRAQAHRHHSVHQYYPKSFISTREYSIDDNSKWLALEEIVNSDAKNPKLQEIANHLWEAALHRPMCFFALAQALARDCIKYTSDINQFGHEDIAGVTRSPEPDDAIDALTRGKDDCDAKARLFVALCLARGFQAKLEPHWHDGLLKHVSALVNHGGWIPVETILTRARLGDTPDSVPVEKDTGKWLQK